MFMDMILNIPNTRVDWILLRPDDAGLKKMFWISGKVAGCLISAEYQDLADNNYMVWTGVPERK